jgi:phosphate transport system substrate-binding protein
VPITVVRRADSSGTTYAFTSHLNAVSDAWKKEHGGPGKGKSVTWPLGIAGKGNAGVAALIKQTPGAVGYLEFGYADLAHLPMARLQNKHGSFIEPSQESGRAALVPPSLTKIPDDLHVEVNDPVGEGAHPIVTCTWLLCSRHYGDAARAEVLKEVLHFCLTDGQRYSEKLGYIPLPDALLEKCRAAVDQIGP